MLLDIFSAGDFVREKRNKISVNVKITKKVEVNHTTMYLTSGMLIFINTSREESMKSRKTGIVLITAR